MAKSHEVLGMLIPNGGYVQVGDDYEGIEFIDCEPITKKQFLQVVPENWELEIEDNYYSYGYYSVIIN